MVEREGTTVANLVMCNVADVAAHDTAANQETAVSSHQVNVNVSAGQQPRLALGEQANIRDVDGDELAAGAQSNS